VITVLKTAGKIAVISALAMVASWGCSFYMVNPIRWRVVNGANPTPAFAQTIAPRPPAAAEKLKDVTITLERTAH
jgi:hypothetical protein